MKHPVVFATMLSTLSLIVAAVPAKAETTVIKKVHRGEFGGVHKKVVIKRHGMGGTTVKKVIRHDD
jgi:hypothetical protein